MRSVPDEELRAIVKRCLEGEQHAMGALVERYRGQVFGLCYRMLGHRQDAEDVMQESFVRVLKNLHRWDSERDFEPWLLAITGNRCRTALSTRGRRPPSQPMVEHLADHRLDLLGDGGLSEEVQLALQNIKANYREAFVLFHEHELSYAEIAEIMECPVGTVKTWIHRARKDLIQQLQQRGVVEERQHAVRKV